MSPEAEPGTGPTSATAGLLLGSLVKDVTPDVAAKPITIMHRWRHNALTRRRVPPLVIHGAP